MSINLERSIHPDLLEETLADAEAASISPTPRRRRGSHAPPSDPSPPGAQTDGVEGGSGEASVTPSEPAAPEWLTAVTEAQDPLQKLALLLKNIPRDDLEKDDTIKGWLGAAADRRARRMLLEAEEQRLDRDRQQAYDRGDLYTLGQLDAATIQARRQELEQQVQAQNNPYRQAIAAFQQGLPEAVQRDVQGKTYGAGKSEAEGFQEYLQAVHESALSHGLADEVRKRENGFRKAELNGTVGSEMTPELDGGPAQSVREITDAQVAAMTLEEFDRFFDDKGRPRPGVRVRLERGIDVRREQRR